MMKRIIIAILLIAILLIVGKKDTFASFERIDQINNKFGIHLAVVSEEDLQDAASLVNSQGGDWGYVTVVIEEKDRNLEKWQSAFDKMRELHLIPIVRLATSMEGSNWRAPKTEDAKDWADFLDSLNWVVKNRYIVLFNEPNHAKEWGGKIDPASYGQVALGLARKLKEKNPDFFVMLAGFDAAAPHKLPDFEDEELFLHKMFVSLPNWGQELISLMDGWASHSYPNHGFVGSPYGWGRNSIRTYLWEINFLKRFNIGDDLPVFITETGWPHNEGINLHRGYYSQKQVAGNFRLLFIQLPSDPKIVAITPFILNYQSDLFDQFSWRKPGSREFYLQFETVRQLAKIKGEPRQEQKLTVMEKLPQKLVRGSTYQINLRVKNEGQAIWSQKEDYHLDLVNAPLDLNYFFSDFGKLGPGEETVMRLHLKTPENLAKLSLSLAVTKNTQAVSNQYPWSLEVLPAPSLKFNVAAFPKIKTSGDDFKILLYNEQNEVVFEKDNVGVRNGQGAVEEVNNLAIETKYRVVILKPYYLPRQEFLVFQEGQNQITFKPMLPLDFNRDGKLSFVDLFTIFIKPRLARLWWSI